MAQLFTNNAAATLAAGISSGTTSITLATGKGALFPSPTGSDYFLLTLATGTPETRWEIVKVTARSGDVLTVVRAQDGTSAQAWAAGDVAELRWVAENVSAISGASAHANFASVTIVGISDRVQLSVKAFAGQAANLAEWLSSAGSVVASLTTAGALAVASTLAVGGATVPGGVAMRVQSPGSNDAGVEIQRTSATNITLLSYNRAGSAYTSLTLDGSQHTVSVAGVAKLTVGSGGDVAIANSTASTSTTTGALVVTGGIGTGGAVNGGGTVTSRHGQADATAIGAFGNGGGGIQFGTGGNTAILYQDSGAWGTLQTSGGLNVLSTAPVAIFSNGGIKIAADKYLQFDGGGVLIGATTGGSAFFDASGAAASAGDVVLNAKTGRTAFIQVASSTKFSVTTATISVLPSTASTSSTTGALVVTGGMGVGGAVNLGSTLSAAGTITCGGNSATSSIFYSNTAAGNNHGFQLAVAGVLRWYVFSDSGAESGGDVGSTFNVSAYTDAGAFIDSPLTISRASGGTITLGGSTSRGVRINGTITVAEAKNIAVGTTTGTIIGVSTSQKLAFWGKTPITQPAAAAQAAVATTAATNTAPYGYTTAAQADGIVTLLNEIRNVLVNTGIMKGAA